MMIGPTILVIEDEFLISEMVATSLSDGGYEVVQVISSNKALAELEADADRFRAIITDIRLGNGPDGWDLARRARELVPNIAVIYMTGDSGPDWSARGVPNSVVIVKPFAPAEIVTTVSALIVQSDAQRLG